EAVNFQQTQSTAQSTYNSLQMSLTKRLSRGLQFLASYTFGKSIDNGSGFSVSTGDAVDGSPCIGKQFDNRANPCGATFHLTHRVLLSYLWDLARPGFAEHSTVTRLLFSNWEVAGVMTGMSGCPKHFSCAQGVFA